MAWLKRHWHWLFLLVIPIVPLWRAVLLGEAIGPFDQIRQFAPWNGPAPKDAWDVLQADGVLQFYVWRDLVLDSWRHFQIPFWNPYELLGTPLLANSQSGALYPPHILLGVLQTPTPLAITLLAWFHLFWAGLGTSKLVRALDGSEIGGVVAGASFALSPLMLSWTALSSVITTVAWIPWALWAVASFRGQGLGRAAADDKRNLVKVSGILAMTIGMMILGGHLQFAAYGVGAVVLFTLFNLSQMRASAVFVLAAIFVGALIASPQLLPVLKHSAESHRRNVPTESGYKAYIGSAIMPFEFANLTTSKALGDPRSPVEVGTGFTVAEYWPPFAKSGANFAESAVTLGPLILGLLFLVPWRDRRTWPIATIGVLALLLATGTVLNKALYFGLPGWSSTGSPGRIIVLFVMTACVLAGLGVREVDKRQLGFSFVGTALLSALTIFVLPWLAPPMQAGMDQIAGAVKGIASAGAPMAFLIALVVGAGIFCLLPKSEKPGSIDPQGLLTAIPVLLAAAAYLTLVPTGKSLANILTGDAALQIPVDRFNRIAFVNDDWGIISAAKGSVLPPNLAALFRVHDAAGYDSLLNKDTKTMLDEANGGDSAPPANGNLMFIKPTATAQKLAELGVRELWSRRPIEAFGQPLTQENGYIRYRVVGPGRLGNSGGQSKVLSESVNAVEAEAQGPGRLTLRDRNLPGWSATIDGKPAALGNGRWLEVEVPAGNHKVQFSYVAPGFGTGLLFGIPALVLSLGALLWRRRVEPASPSDPRSEVQ